MMRVSNHGGRCCGVKHIHEFPAGPSYTVAALPKRVKFHGAAGEMQAPGKAFYPGPRPSETGAKRLEDIIDYIDRHKESHLVEVILGALVADNWQKELEKYGFKRVTEFTNSNTHCKLVVFHRVTYKGEVVK